MRHAYRIFLSCALVMPLWACSMVAGPSHAQSAVAMRPPVGVTVIHFNPVMAPRNILTEIQSCRKDDICNAALSGLLTYLGVPPEAVGALNMVPTTGNRNGEISTDTYRVPPGHTICQIHVGEFSVAPLSGDRASHFKATASDRQLDLYAWTPRQGLGKGQSWVDVSLTVAYVRTADLARLERCGLGSQAVTYECRGDGNNSHGHQACRSTRMGELAFLPAPAAQAPARPAPAHVTVRQATYREPCSGRQVDVSWHLQALCHQSGECRFDRPTEMLDPVLDEVGRSDGYFGQQLLCPRELDVHFACGDRQDRVVHSFPLNVPDDPMVLACR